MNVFTTQAQWIIVALVFVLGLLIGMFLTAGGRKKWKTRYYDEVRDREAIEERHREREREWDGREKEWRERDSLRGAAIKDRDSDGDGIRDDIDRRPTDDRRA